MKKGLSGLALGLLLLCGVGHAGTVTYVYTDLQGTPLAEADASGTITARFDYAPYGTAVASMSPAPNGPGYTGHVNDADTGLVYMQARYYDPVTAHFLSVDPKAPAAGNTFNFNRYAYANNNPIVNIDPDGRQIAGTANNNVDWNERAKANAQFIGYLLTGTNIDQVNAPGDDSIQSVVTPLEFGLGSGVSDLGSAGVGFFARASTTASVDFSSSTALSTSRMTTTGESFFHYGSASQAQNFSGGLRANSFATSLGDLSPQQAQAGLALPHTSLPDAVYKVTPETGTWVNMNPIAEPKFGQPGGLPEFLFPNGTGPGTVSAPRNL
ncbi:RHS repeat-associated core domain-containing protein [Rhodanobacter glycinis]|uniref:RHS repeat-associated core domain-containing protein n=1 Tax=Rhodanobacter glycinis TaxID=582702 RepID=A0A502BXY1_9GAMM|nr:RHS repeat-associated core domain-containing protein [Rhodanobacter glycinis]TPG05348.1 RHS repeat-associated core domain-containing protein [Rhodanobacter glycinis]